MLELLCGRLSLEGFTDQWKVENSIRRYGLLILKATLPIIRLFWKSLRRFLRCLGPDRRKPCVVDLELSLAVPNNPAEFRFSLRRRDF